MGNKKEMYVFYIYELLSKKLKPSLHYQQVGNDIIEYYFMGNLSNGTALIYTPLCLEVIVGIDPSGDLIFDDVKFSYFSSKKYSINGKKISERDLINEARKIIKMYKNGYVPSRLYGRNDVYMDTRY